MPLFGKSVPDQVWREEVLPLFEFGFPLGTAFSQAIEDGDVEAQIVAAHQVIEAFPAIRERLKRAGTPTSREARRVKKSLDLALKDHIEGARLGVQFYRDLGGGLGDRLVSGGFAGRAAAGRTAFQQNLFQEIVKKAAKRMDESASFFEYEPG